MCWFVWTVSLSSSSPWELPTLQAAKERDQSQNKACTICCWLSPPSNLERSCFKHRLPFHISNKIIKTHWQTILQGYDFVLTDYRASFLYWGESLASFTFMTVIPFILILFSQFYKTFLRQQLYISWFSQVPSSHRRIQKKPKQASCKTLAWSLCLCIIALYPHWQYNNLVSSLTAVSATMQFTDQSFSVSSSFLQSHQEKRSRRWTAMKENRAITVGEAFPQAKARDRGCLITRYSMSTCCVRGAKAGTKDLNFKMCSKVG